ncbi:MULTISPECIES: LacI family DNA-binding transcriptional regulator [unclassified Mycolicibacterium]|uniref:LacI family DNA-binding transcriptional regulator n=1 Tax=unclassified Mycolicibacterium TaxID=2636767 RepID=UPI002EDA9D96
MATIAEVARLAGVSPTTVSHALSGRRAVSEETRRRVQEVMDELGYSPRRAAQNLATGGTRLLGLIVPDISNSFFAELAKGVEEAAIDAGYNMVLCNSAFNHDRELLYLETIRSRAVDGVVYAAGSPTTHREMADSLGSIPVVLVDEEVLGSSACSFVSDNAEGGRLAAEHLIGLGHTEAVILSMAGLASSDDRAQGFSDAWVSHDLPQPAVIGGDFTYDGGYAALRNAVGPLHNIDFSAVFATNDLMALGAMKRLMEIGLHVPEDVSVVGFDDITIAGMTNPGLTTVRQDVWQLGFRAAEALIASIDTSCSPPAERHVQPVELIVRGTTSLCMSDAD